MNLEDEISKLQEEIAVIAAKKQDCPKSFPSFEVYAHDLRKVPSDELYLEYLGEIKTLLTSNKKITKSQAEFVKSRNTWSDVVSETYDHNQASSGANKTEAIERIRRLGHENAKKLFQDCIDYLTNNTVITFTFNSEFLSRGLDGIHPLNIFEKPNNKSAGYIANRERYEKSFLDHLSQKLKNQVFNNPHARPRYCALKLLDKDSVASQCSDYGSSFIVFKNSIKFNSLFAAGDTFNDFNVCTIHNFELLLKECPEHTLQALLWRVTTGSLPDDFSQSSSYLEAMIPSVSVFDPNFVEHIHIDKDVYEIPPNIKKKIEKLGISVTNYWFSSPYKEEQKKLWAAINHWDKVLISKILANHPTLISISNNSGEMPIHLAVKKGNLEAVKILMKANANPYLYTPEHKNALHYAIEGRNTEIITFLMKDYNDSIIKNEWPENTLLQTAIATGQMNLAKNIFDQHSQSFTLPQLGYVLHKLFAIKDYNFIEKIIQARKEVITHYATYGNVLNLAAIHNQTNLVKKLCEMGAKADYADDKNRTALQLALKQKNLDIIKIIIQHELRDMPVKDLGEVAKFLLEKNEAATLNQLLTKRTDTMNELTTKQRNEFLVYLVENNHWDIAQKIIMLPTKIDNKVSIKNSGNTALHIAVMQGRKESIQALCSLGADPVKRNKAKQSALDMAILYRDIDSIKTILTHTAKEIPKKLLTTCFQILSAGRAANLDLVSQISQPEIQAHIGLAVIIKMIQDTANLDDVEKLHRSLTAQKPQFSFLQKNENWSQITKLIKNRILNIKLFERENTRLKPEIEALINGHRRLTFLSRGKTTSAKILTLAESNRNEALEELAHEETEISKWSKVYCG